MGLFGSDRPQTSVTVKINQICQPHFNAELEDDLLELQMSDLLHLIKIQPHLGATEAARAIRKKIKYGEGSKVQCRALQLLEILVLNGGTTIGSTIARDDKLCEVLRGVISGKGVAGDGGEYPSLVTRQARLLAQGWRLELADMREFQGMPRIWEALPGSRSRGPRRQREPENVFDLPRNRLEESPLPLPLPLPPRRASPPRKSPPKPATPKKKKLRWLRKTRDAYKVPQINYRVEAPKIRATLAESQTSATKLVNTLTLLPNGVLPVDDADSVKQFEKCKRIRRKVLRYLQFVGAGDPSRKTAETAALDEEFLGALILANEQLVDAFKRYDRMSGILDTNQYDNINVSSDESYYTESDEEDDQVESTSKQMEGMLLRAPPPPPPKPVERHDTSTSVTSDPFGDGHGF